MKDGLLSLALFFGSNVFITTKLNAVGISTLPAAVRTFRERVEHDPVKKRELVKKGLLWSARFLHCAAVVGGLRGAWPKMIKVDAVWRIVGSVKESIETRLEKEAEVTAAVLAEEERKRKSKREKVKRKFFSLSRFIKNLLLGGTSDKIDNDEDESPAKEGSDGSDDPKSKTDVTRHGVSKARRVLKGKRDSATDDLLWGVFQISFVVFDQGRFEAVGHAWLVFMLSVLEEAVLNPDLKPEQKVKKVAIIAAVAYASGKLVF